MNLGRNLPIQVYLVKKLLLLLQLKEVTYLLNPPSLQRPTMSSS